MAPRPGQAIGRTRHGARAGRFERHRLAGDERTVVVSLTGATLKDHTEGIPAEIGRAFGLDTWQRRELITTTRQITAAVQRNSGGVNDAQP